MIETEPEVTVDELSVHLAWGTADDLANLLRSVGERWPEQPTDAWRRAGLSAGVAERLDALRDGLQARTELRHAASEGIRLVAHRHADYPAALRTLAKPPVVLAVRGRWPVTGPVLAIVGARAATPSGRQAASVLAARAVAAGVAIVSGLARGIDRCALEAAVERRGWAVGVLGCGVDVTYPRENHQLQRTMGTGGTLISEFPMGMRPDRWTFPRRNRIIAALAEQVLVVEAGARSGALITAGHALELGRDVWAVPGPIDAPQSEGSNRLIFDGAQPIISEEVLLELLGYGGAARRCPAPADPLLAALGRAVLSADEVARAAGLPVSETRARLIALELEGSIRRLPGGRYARRR